MRKREGELQGTRGKTRKCKTFHEKKYPHGENADKARVRCEAEKVTR